MKKNFLEMEIRSLEFSTNIIQKLQENEIMYVNDLWILKRKKLKEIGLTDNEINQVVIKLQLNGLDLNKKKY